MASKAKSASAGKPTTASPAKKTAAPAKAAQTAAAKIRKSATKPAATSPAATKPAGSSKSGKAAIKGAGKTAAKASRPSSAKGKAAAKGKAPLKAATKSASPSGARLLESKVAFEGPLFRIHRDRIVEPSGHHALRDVIRHNGSVVILAVDYGKGKGKDRKDPWIVIERQYRHATGQFLWELPAGKLDPGEDPLRGAQRELAEETGYAAHHWSKLIYYYPSPGFLGEGMHIFLAEGLIPGDAHPEEDEAIDFRLVRLSDLLEKIRKGNILDGKTLVGAMLFEQIQKRKSHKK